MASNENSRMLMPWPVKVVWWWYLTLVCASCIPLVFCLVKCDPFGRGELFQLLAGTASLAAYFSGLALAVRPQSTRRSIAVSSMSSTPVPTSWAKTPISSRQPVR